MPNKAKAYIATVIVTGAAILGYGLANWRPDDPIRFAVFLALFIAAAALKCKLPGITGTYSPLFFFALLGSATLPFSQAVLASALGGIVQCTFRTQSRPAWMQICFNAANLVISSASGFVFLQRQIPGLDRQPLPISLILGACVFYFVNTALVSIVLTLVERGSFRDMWGHWCLRSLSYYAVGALIVGATLSTGATVNAAVVMLVAPSILLPTIYYRRWLRGGGL